ncbi:conserved protein of unknown function [Tepidanaerobacter acetatoxydans Re1]|uniref:Chalcone isomerase N-terminal domain-containing protein n=1 Tax=Tepidanaerobacter acetatoxydans (strain DSM 21804 / JCM 16047 / Re1) TaxID=1209989 RepID=F4LS17_TEPAE|nr:hypothetical protein [Tepidanaerobacter acetatoxydans]AEE92356.1 hypothetical protein TepRe1_2234 [Tepidanaerobacter acetatoxydans Re1]CCP27245.1 conserved protein of unknown function [Tepidanaerobacter acetatoxydans Re1]
MDTEFKPMRSLIYVGVAKEEYRHKLKNWLYRYHIPDSISQFAPYVTKYAFYNALPVPPEGERFGAYNMQLTEHYWLINPMNPQLKIKAFTEFFPVDVLKWQGNIPDDADADSVNIEGDAARSSGGDNGMPPFIFAFIPFWWEEDFKGAGRTVEDGPNYRWQFLIQYPNGISLEEGDQWFYKKLVPAFKEMPEVNRFLTSRVIRDVNDCQFHRVIEMWFDGPEEWYRAAVEKGKSIERPHWATAEEFPYLKPKFQIASLFLTDIADSDNYSQYRGYITMR